MMRLSTRSLVVVGCMATALAVGCSEAGDDGSTGSARQGLDTTSSTDASPAGATGESVSVAALGSCKSSAQCDDNNPCTTDKCVGGMCRFTAKANGAKCNDANACTTSDKCASGVCQGKAVANGTACNDSNACTRTDRCRAGLCAGTNPIVCGGADQCHDNGTCDRSTGTCSPPPAKPNGSACNDGNACTQTDSCQSGACTGSNPVVCIASDQCHVPGSCDPATGVCSNPPISDGAGCVGACGLAATCRGGACVDSNPVACSSIGASGGSVELPGVADLNIPPGALTSQTTIVVHQVSAPSAGASGVMLTTAAVELEPDGLIFQTPATLTLAYDPTLLSPATAARQAIYQFAGGVLLPASPTTVDTSALTLSMPLTHFSSYVGGLAVSSPACTSLYSDGFEADSGWGMFEEIVGGNPCYASGIGAVYPSTEASAGGSSSLKVWANRTNSQYSDHVIGQKKLYDTGKSGIWKYSVAAYISPTTANTGQAGPEISMQNTRSPSPGVYSWTTPAASSPTPRTRRTWSPQPLAAATRPTSTTDFGA